MQRYSILVIDGEEAVRESLQIVLEEEGYRCFVAPNKSEGKKLLSREAIDVIVIDSQLIGSKDFFSCVIRDYPKTRIIIMSTYVEVDVTQKALIWGAHDFLLKPLDFKELLDKLEFYFPRKAS